MARSSSAKNGKNSKNTYRASGSKSSKSSSSGARHNSSSSGSKKRMSRLEQRRAQQQNLIRSVVLAGFGILAIALVLVPGQSFWNVLRSWLFGTFGVVTYFVGPFLLYLAYLLASGYHVGTFIGKVLLLAVLLAGTAVIFSDFKVGDTPWQTVKMLFAWGQRKFWTGGVLGVPIGASLLAVCGRPGANIVMIIVILMGLMVFFAVTPVDVVQFISYYIQEFKARRAARAEEETAYDTQLFGHEAEEESLENLTGSLPPMAGESPATPQSGTRRPFDVAPYLEQEEAARRNAAQANPADQAAAAAQVGQPAAQPQQTYTQPGTATYPDMQRAQAAPQGVQHTQSFAPPAQHSDFDVDLYVTGSNSRMMSYEISTYMTGRYVSFRIFTLSFGEYLMFKSQYTEVGEPKAELANYVRLGGFPAAHLQEYSQDEVYTIVRDIYNSTIFSDIVKRNQVRKIDQLERVVKYTFNNVGNTFSAKSISDYLKAEHRALDNETVYSYLEKLEKAYLLHRCSRFDLQGKEILKTQEKFYLADTALRYSVLGYNADSVASSLENVMYLELCRRGYTVHVGKSGCGEIDFVAVRQNEKLYVQITQEVRSEKTEKREYERLLEIHDNYPPAYTFRS